MSGGTASAAAIFARSLGDRIPVFRDVLTAYALELVRGSTSPRWLLGLGGSPPRSY